MQSQQWQLNKTTQLTPLSFPLWAEFLQSQTMSSESFQGRIARLLKKLESAMDNTTDG